MIALRGQWELAASLARRTSWRVGGAARRLYRPADRTDLSACLAQLEPDEPLLWLGLGSNLLVSDDGFAGTVIHTLGCLNGLEIRPDNRLWVEAGVSCAQASRQAARHGLGGIEFLAGIPGTIGGALALNAGAWGSEIWHWVARVWTINRQGFVHERTPKAFTIGYRQVTCPDQEWFVAAELELESSTPAQVQARIRELLAQRNAKQPIGALSAGSVFRNPPGDYAARLIDAAGCKGWHCGDAEVSMQHANFIVNRGQATACDIQRLLVRVQTAVEQCAGVRLIPEIHHIGAFELC